MSRATHSVSVEMGCQTQNLGRGVMVSHARERPKLTAKGERARARIVAASARLIRQRGVAGTTLEDVKAAAHVRGSQPYHYFPDKDDLVQAVLDYFRVGKMSSRNANPEQPTGRNQVSAPSNGSG